MPNAFDGFPTIINPATIGQNALAGFQTGRKFRQDIEAQGALSRYAMDPSAANVNALMPHNPDLALKLQTVERERAFGDAATRMYTGRNSALPTRPTGNPGAMGQTGSPAQAPSNPDFRVLGAPQSDADAAFLDMLKIDAKKAMAMDSDMRDRAADRLKLQRDAYGLAVSRLGGVTDDAGYQAALGEIQRMIEPLGVNVTDHLPPQFPGKEGLGALRLSALDAKEQLSHLLAVDNTAADNERADRNTDSLDEDRDARRDETRRYHDVQSGNTRRGQDIRSGDTRRGQDRPRTAGKGGSAPKTAAPTATGANGEKYVLRDGKWVRTN